MYILGLIDVFSVTWTAIIDLPYSVYPIALYSLIR